MKHIVFLGSALLLLWGCNDPLIQNPTSSPSQGTVVTLPDGTTVITPSPPAAAPPKAPSDQVFLDNGQVRVGIDLGSGGAITYLAEKGGDNLINNHDLGRQVQTSLYAGPTVFKPHGKLPLASHFYSGWNPNQAGNYVPQSSKIVSWQKIDDTHLYVKTIPLFYAYVDEVADCVMENWIELSGNTVNARFQVTVQRNDTTTYYPRPQEAPGIYLNAPWSRAVTYTGNQPFTNGALQTKTYTDGEYETLTATENWVALLNDAGRGLGLWQDNHYRFGFAFFGNSRAGGQLDNQTAYMVGSDYAHLEHNSVWGYSYTLIVGSLADIRQFAYQKPRPATTPDYRFVNDRQRWYSFGPFDQGYPVRGELDILFGPTDQSVMCSSFALWKAADVPKLYIQAAFTSKATTTRFGWRKLGDTDGQASPNTFIDIPIIGDGQYRTYVINLANVSGWQGYVTQIGIASPFADPTTRMRLRSVTTTPP